MQTNKTFFKVKATCFDLDTDHHQAKKIPTTKRQGKISSM